MNNLFKSASGAKPPMPERTVTVLRGALSIHGRQYEMYSGFMTPNDLISMASVPSFEREMSPFNR